jgi:hypothetical protein
VVVAVDRRPVLGRRQREPGACYRSENGGGLTATPLPARVVLPPTDPSPPVLEVLGSLWHEEGPGFSESLREPDPSDGCQKVICVKPRAPYGHAHPPRCERRLPPSPASGQHHYRPARCPSWDLSAPLVALSLLLRTLDIYPAALHVVLTTMLDRGRNGAEGRSDWIRLQDPVYELPGINPTGSLVSRN